MSILWRIKARPAGEASPGGCAASSNFERLAGHHLMDDVVVGRDAAPTQQAKADFDDPRPIFVHFVGDGADDRTAWLTHLFEHFRNAVLADNDHLFAPLQLFHRL